MENRRHSGSNPGTPYNQQQQQNRYYKKQDDRSYGERKFESRGAAERGGDRYAPRENDRYAPRDRDGNGGGFGSNNRFQPRDNNSNGGGSSSGGGGRRYHQPRHSNGGAPGDNRFQPRNEDRFRGPRDNRFPPREDRFRPRDGGERDARPTAPHGDRRDNRFPPRDGNGGGRFSSNNRFQPRDNRFPPRRNFIPRGAKPTEQPWKSLDLPKVYDEMQVTDGKHRGKFLTSTASPKVRPTARRIREVMFRLIFRRVRAGRFLDLCAGSGAVGIEAISRGALLSTFVERSGKMCSYIKKNLEGCGIKEGHGEVCEIEVVPFLKKMQKRRRFWDVVYFDPPYDTNYDEVLDYFKRGTAIKPGGLLVIEHHAEMFFPEKIGLLRRWRVINQGDTALSFYERKS